MNSTKHKKRLSPIAAYAVIGFVALVFSVLVLPNTLAGMNVFIKSVYAVIGGA